MMHTSIYKNRKWYQVFTLFCLDSVGGRQWKCGMWKYNLSANFDDTCILDSYMYFRGLTPSLAPVNCICPLPVGRYLCILHLFTNKMTCKHYQHKLQYWLATTSQHVNIMEFLPSPPTFSQNRALYTPGG